MLNTNANALQIAFGQALLILPKAAPVQLTGSWEANGVGKGYPFKRLTVNRVDGTTSASVTDPANLGLTAETSDYAVPVDGRTDYTSGTRGIAFLPPDGLGWLFIATPVSGPGSPDITTSQTPAPGSPSVGTVTSIYQWEPDSTHSGTDAVTVYQQGDNIDGSGNPGFYLAVYPTGTNNSATYTFLSTAAGTTVGGTLTFTGTVNFTGTVTGAGATEVSYYRDITQGRYYIGGEPRGAPLTLSTAALTADRIYAMPFCAPRGGTLDRIAFFLVGTAASGKARVGIYSNTSDTNLYPDDLVLDSGEIDISTGASTLKTTTISQAITAGALYWLVYHTNSSAATLRCYATANTNPILGLDTTLSTPGGVWIVTDTFGALPDPFTAGGTIHTGTNSPIVGVRFSA